jgi:hypothetical protein
MKKIFILPLFAMVALVSQAWAAPCLANGTTKVYCAWGGNLSNCWQINDTDDEGVFLGCDTQAGYCTSANMYSGAGYTNGICSGMTQHTCPGGSCSWSIPADVVWCDFGPPSQYGDGGCFEKERDDCIAEKGTPVASQSQCGQSPAETGPFCYWALSEYNTTCYCGVVDGAVATAANCTEDSGEIVTSCTGKCGSTNPIFKPIPNATLTVSPFGRSLHIASPKDATISLYDMSGAKVYSGKVRAGNSVFSLEKVSSGSYYAIVQSGSASKKVPVILK